MLGRAWNPFVRSPLISERVEQTGGRASGFDYMRLLLALSIIGWHSIVTCYGTAAQERALDSFIRIPVLALLPMFFALSGFLVAGSLERTKHLGIFLGLRALRIVPALAVDTIFSALVLGAALTSLSFISYVSDPQFRDYFLNIAGFIHYYLPGVFEQNPTQKVNGQLWTIPFELECYIVLAVLAAVGIFRRRAAFAFLILTGTVLLEIRVLITGVEPNTGRVLVLCFLAGVAIHLYRDRIYWNWPTFSVAVLAMTAFLSIPELGYLSSFPAAYLTVFLGLQNPRKNRLLESGDYSYGLFLYGYPIQQCLVATIPFAREWYGNIALAIPLSFGFAAASWHLLEKRALAQKRYLYPPRISGSAA